MTLRITHNAGFFSCCTVRLQDITKFYDEHKFLPDIVDSSEQFDWYKVHSKKDVTFEYFDNYTNYSSFDFTHRLNFTHFYQFKNYSSLNYSELTPFVKKYFSPSAEITSMITDLETKYRLNYANICVLYYRGNDKCTETVLSGHNDYIVLAKQILQKDPATQFLIQSDETEFIEKMLATFPDNSFYMKEEIRHMKRCINTVDRIMRTDIEKFSKLYLAITIIMSKCKYIICGTGNCSFWILLYRGHADNLIQFNMNTWIKS